MGPTHQLVKEMLADNTGSGSDGISHLTLELGSWLAPESFRIKRKSKVFPICVHGKQKWYRNSVLKWLLKITPQSASPKVTYQVYLLLHKVSFSLSLFSFFLSLHPYSFLALGILKWIRQTSGLTDSQSIWRLQTQKLWHNRSTRTMLGKVHTLPRDEEEIIKEAFLEERKLK